jgi:iron complex transport system substrate-binding protein
MAAFLVPASRRPRTPVPALLFIVLLLAGCAATGGSSPSIAPITPNPTVAPTAAPPAFPVTVTDDEGTAVAIAAAPTKIVSLTPAATEILYAIGAGSKVVAKVEDIANFPPEAASVPVVATYKGVDVEKIIAAGADLVVSGGANFGQGPADDQLRRANIPVVVLAPTTTAQVLADIQLVGNAAGSGSAASALVAAMTDEFAVVRALTANVTHPKVFYEVDAYQAIYTVTDGSFTADLLQIAGGDPVTTGSTTNSEISIEALVAANPTLILLGDTASLVTPDQVKARPGWGTIAAVTSGTILGVNDVVITRPGPRLFLGVLELLRAIHPEITVPAGLPTPLPTLAPAT